MQLMMGWPLHIIVAVAHFLAYCSANFLMSSRFLLSVGAAACTATQRCPNAPRCTHPNIRAAIPGGCSPDIACTRRCTRCTQGRCMLQCWPCSPPPLLVEHVRACMALLWVWLACATGAHCQARHASFGPCAEAPCAAAAGWQLRAAKLMGSQLPHS
jgi:hypothetical protein